MPFKPLTRLPFNAVSTLEAGKKYDFTFVRATTLPKADKNGNPLELAHGTHKGEPVSGLIQRINPDEDVEMVEGTTYKLYVSAGSNSYNRGVVAV